MDMLMALALSIGILIAAWVKLGPMANLAVPAGIIAWGCFFAAGGKMQGLQKTVAATISGVFWVWLAMTLVGMMNMGNVAFIIIGIVAFILVMQSKVATLAVIPPGTRCRGTVLPPERAEVQHPPVGRPEKGACAWLAAAIGLPRLARPDDIAEIVDVISTARPPAEGAQIDDPGLLGPQKRPTASTHDLAPVVDAKRHARGSPEGSEIAHPVRGGPEECMRLPRARFRKAGDLAAVVHVMRDARRSAEAPQVEHPPRLRDEERVLGHAVASAAVPRDLPQPIDREGLALVPAERAEVEARALGQEVGVKVTEPGVPSAHDFSRLADVIRRAAHAAQGPQVGDAEVRRPQERPAPAQAVPARSHDVALPVDGFGLADGAAQRAEVLDRNIGHHGGKRAPGCVQTAGLRPSCKLAHIPASTAVSAVGPSNRCTRMAGRPFRLTATMWRIETVSSAGLYFNRSWAPPASPLEPSGIAGRARALKSSTQAWSTSIASFCGPWSAMHRPLPYLCRSLSSSFTPARWGAPSARPPGVTRRRSWCRVDSP